MRSSTSTSSVARFYTNNPYTGAFRGFGVNQVTFAMEQQINKLAHALGIAPATCGGGTSSATAASSARAHGVACGGLGRTASASDDARAAPAGCHARTATGATGAAWPARSRTSASASASTIARPPASPSRAAAPRCGSPRRGRPGHRDRAGADRGRGAWRCRRARYGSRGTTRPRRQAAGSASASHQTFVSGNAVRRACEQARPGDCRARADGRGCRQTASTAFSTFQAPSTDPLTSAAPTRHAYSYAWSACVADVGVDLETGRVRVLRVVNALDAGRVINPHCSRPGGRRRGDGQGYALQERCGARRHAHRLRLRGCNLPTAVDAVPIIETMRSNGPSRADLSARAESARSR